MSGGVGDVLRSGEETRDQLASLIEGDAGVRHVRRRGSGVVGRVLGTVGCWIVGAVCRCRSKRDGSDLRMDVDQHLVAVGAAAGGGQLNDAGLVGGGAEGVVGNAGGVVPVPLPGAQAPGGRVHVGDVAVGRAVGVFRDGDVVVLAIGRGGRGDGLRLRKAHADTAHGGLQGDVLGVADACAAGTGAEVAEGAFAAAGERNADGQCKQEEQTDDKDTAQRKPPRNTAKRGAAVSTKDGMDPEMSYVPV